MKREQSGEDMVDIMAHLHKYVPKNAAGKFYPIIFGGDQLTKERATGAQDAKLQSTEQHEKLKGLIPVVEDWHAWMTFYQVCKFCYNYTGSSIKLLFNLQVIWNKLYSKDSIADKGTLAHLQTILRRTCLPTTKVKNDMNAVEDFMNLVYEAHIIAATMEHFKMDDISDVPQLIQEAQQSVPTETDLMNIVGKLVNKYVMKFVETDVQEQVLGQGQASVGTQYPPRTEDPEAQDQVRNYASRVIGYGLLAKNFRDAWKEGDGARTVRMWKFFLLYFKDDGRTKYALEAFRLGAQIVAMLSPRRAHQLIWNRTCNSKGGRGENVPLDLKNEYLNAIFKADLNTFHSHISEHSVQRSSQSLRPVQDILDRFDHVTSLYTDSGRHSQPDLSNDFKLVLKTLRAASVFSYHSGRKHSSIKAVHADPLFKLKSKLDDFYKWIRQHQKSAAIQQALDKSIF